LAIAFAEVVRNFGLDRKILAVTCDNASNNDTMATELGALLTAFSPVNRIRCFAHVINLISKSLLKQFDVKPEEDDFHDDDDNPPLFELAKDIETEEIMAAQETDNDEVEDDDEVDDWVDDVEALTMEERANMENFIRPAKRTLVKVRDCNTSRSGIPCAD
jgi:hypothetical protein